MIESHDDYIPIDVVALYIYRYLNYYCVLTLENDNKNVNILAIIYSRHCCDFEKG